MSKQKQSPSKVLSANDTKTFETNPNKIAKPKVELPAPLSTEGFFRIFDIDLNKVAIYIRWSTDEQGDGTTLEVQLDNYKHYVLSHG